ncbi:MAG: site-2 protease family protein, partial [Chloroflexi bacterium]|nr:site-2 protease family protein [Chloroflexota bacterium]
MIDFLFTVVVFVLVLSLLVLVHEFGHYWVARLLGIQVRELGIGFPPRLAAITRGGIVYSINWLPFGGFVRLHGEENPEEPRGFAGKSIRVRTAVIAAGSVMNLALAWVIFSFIAALPFQTATGDVVIEGISAGSPAEAVGLKPGDVIDAVDGAAIESTFDLALMVRESRGKLVTLQVPRDGGVVTVPVVPRTDYPANQGPIGVEVSLDNIVVTDERIPIWTAPIEGLRTGLAIMGFVGDEGGSWIQG